MKEKGVNILWVKRESIVVSYFVTRYVLTDKRGMERSEKGKRKESGSETKGGLLECL